MMIRSKTTSRQILAVALATMILSATAFADPVWRGTGRGTGGTVTFQQWSFADSNHSPSPNADLSNDYGIPTMWIGDRVSGITVPGPLALTRWIS